MIVDKNTNLKMVNPIMIRITMAKKVPKINNKQIRKNFQKNAVMVLNAKIIRKVLVVICIQIQTQIKIQ